MRAFVTNGRHRGVARALAVIAIGLHAPFGAPVASGQTPDRGLERPPLLSLGFAVDTTVRPDSWWGVDPALAVRAGVVRFWSDYLRVRGDSARRRAFWSAADRRRAADPDLVVASEGYIVGVSGTLVEALPLVAGDSSRWMLRTVYTSGGTLEHPGLYAMERAYVVRDGARWALTQPSAIETASWRRTRVGRLEYVVHPRLRFNAARAAETARWADSVARRFGIVEPPLITYYQLPNLEAAFRVMGLEWALSTDRVGGRANPAARVVLAADPRFGEAYRHEIVHVLLAAWLSRTSTFASEGMAYWLGGARGKPFAAMMRDLATFLDRAPLLSLSAIFADGASEAVSSAQFPAAAAVFEWAHRAGGDDAVRRVVEAARAGTPTRDALAAALGVPPSAVDDQWRRVVRSYARTPGERTRP